MKKASKSKMAKLLADILAGKAKLAIVDGEVWALRP